MTDITFRPLEEKDLEDRVRWFNNPEVSKFLGGIPDTIVTLNDQREWYANYLEREDKHFMIEIAGAPVGQVALIDHDRDNKFAKLFIYIGEDEHRGKGIAQEAMKFICDYGFNILRLHKIGLEVNELNLPAIRAYQKFGFIEEARLKEQIIQDGKYHDEIVMAMFNPKEQEKG